MVVAALPSALFVISLIAPERAPHVPYLHVVLIVLALGIAGLNCYLSWVRPLLYLRRHGSRDGYRFVSGIPLIATVLAVGATLLAFGNDGIAIAGIVVQFLDTGSPLWFVYATWNDA